MLKINQRPEAVRVRVLEFYLEGSRIKANWIRDQTAICERIKAHVTCETEIEDATTDHMFIHLIRPSVYDLLSILADRELSKLLFP